MKTTHLLALTAIVLVLSSCVRDDVDVTVTGDRASVWIAAGSSYGHVTRGFGSDDAVDDILEQFRILAFKSGGGTIAYNEVTDIRATTPFRMQILTGTYDFVFIGNEDYEINSPLTAQLESLPASATLSDLESLSFPAKAFDSSGSINIPMSRVIRNVKILGDERYEVDGEESTGQWKVIMKRLATRLDVKIKTDNAVKAGDFKEIVIKNIPTYVPILEEGLSGNKLYNGGAAGSWTKTIKKEDGDDGGFVQSGNTYEWVASRIILPSTVFEQDNEANALTLECHYTSGGTSVAALETGINTKYQVPRNTHLLATMVITPSLSMYLDVDDWDERKIEAIAGLNRELSVSTFNVTISAGSRARVWFSSNMKEVSIDPNLHISMPGAVNDYFKDLTGSSAYNFHYEYDEATGTGTGYMDIMTSDGYSDTGTKTYFINLNANGLGRYIQINVRGNSGVSSGDVGYFEYVGAFWRDDQVGERVITAKNSGIWTAEIVNGQNWVVIAPGKSTDPAIYTSTPGNAEDYPVEGDGYYVEGVGEVSFRIGAKTKNPNRGQPRYGRIRIKTSAGTAYIYLRQGEAEDYIMRPDDYGTSTLPSRDKEWPTKDDPRPRPHAVRFSPFNLTSATSFTGGTSSGNHTTIDGEKGVFVKYPSQGGAFFQWGEPSAPVRAYHPRNPNSASISGWNTTAITSYWNGIMGRQETCPEGYRRPTNGSISGYVNSTGGISDSEILQSLFEDPTSSPSLTRPLNFMYGYYADGYFDRRPIQNATSFQDTGTKWALVSDDFNAAYAGCLVFNPDESYNGSVFFPCPGRRNNQFGSYGVLYNAGKLAQYWTSTSSSTSGHVFSIFYSAGTSSPQPRAGTSVEATSDGKVTGANIRCVKK